MNPRVSVVTTVYDRVWCLDRCLRSMKHLTFRDFEHIVVSDHPPDHLLAQIERHRATLHFEWTTDDEDGETNVELEIEVENLRRVS